VPPGEGFSSRELEDRMKRSFWVTLTIVAGGLLMAAVALAETTIL
jgi:hypothetical protein